MQVRFKDNSETLRITQADYWRASVADLGDLKKIAIAALLIALSVVLQQFSIPLSAGLKIQVTFFLSALGGVMLGPILSLVRGAAADIVGFLVFPTGAFFFGYTLSAMLSALVYSLFLYRKRVTFGRVALSKLIVSVGCNAGLGALWSKMLYGSKTYLVYFLTSLAKQIVLYPFEVAVIILLIGALTPAMTTLGLMPKQEGISLSRRAVTSLGILVFLVGVLLILAFVFKDFTASVFGDVLKFVKSLFGV